MIRLMYGVTAMISVAAGRTTTVGLVPGVLARREQRHRREDVEDARSRRARTSAMPMTNSGSAASTRVVTDRTWSAALSRRTAVKTPSAIDSGIAMIAATSTRNAELAMRSESSCVTGCCVAAEIAQVAVQDAPEPVRVLRDHRLVEVQLLAQRREPLGRGVAAEDGDRRVAGQRLGGGEHQHRDQEQRQQAQEDTVDDEFGHAASGRPRRCTPRA